eukprot:jgi/Botrbrau1/3593/Bobra.0078s0044.1
MPELAHSLIRPITHRLQQPTALVVASRCRHSNRSLRKEFPELLTVCQQHAVQSTERQQQAKGSLKKLVKLRAEPQGWRCCICMHCDFLTRTDLANHLIGKGHGSQWRAAQERGDAIQCPYCGLDCSSRTELNQHVRDVCTRLEDDFIPEGRRRTVSQAQLDADPRYAPLFAEKRSGGRLVVRPLHEQHAYEAAVLLTEAFLVDSDPPRFPWMLAELDREAADYAAEPSPITEGRVDLSWGSSYQAGGATPSPQHSPGSSHEEWCISDPAVPPSAVRLADTRLMIERAWGRWLWLVAEFVPDDIEDAPRGQDSRVIGTIAILFHEREKALQRLALLESPLPASALDYSLWLSLSPPPDLPFRRAAFLWWTGVHYRYRGQGVARRLVRACESLAERVGFPDIYIQAATRQRDRANLLGDWMQTDYATALMTYVRAGYDTWRPKAHLLGWNKVDRSAVLMHRHLAEK